MSMIFTTHGDMDETLLEKREGIDENETARIAWIEYWLDGELVHRSVHVALKQGLDMSGVIADLNGG